MARVAMRWTGAPEADADILLKRAQDSFGDWPNSHDITFREFAVYLLVTEYLRTRGATGTQLDLQRIIGKWIPA